MDQQEVPNNPPPHINLNSLIARAQAQIQAINDYNGPLVDLEDDPPIQGTLYTSLLQQQYITNITNFTNNTLINIFRVMQPFLQKVGTREPKLKSSPMNQLICYLT